MLLGLVKSSAFSTTCTLFESVAKTLRMPPWADHFYTFQLNLETTTQPSTMRCLSHSSDSILSKTRRWSWTYWKDTRRAGDSFSPQYCSWYCLLRSVLSSRTRMNIAEVRLRHSPRQISWPGRSGSNVMELICTLWKERTEISALSSLLLYFPKIPTMYLQFNWIHWCILRCAFNHKS